MKKITALALVLCLLLSGCGTRFDKASPFKKFRDDALSSALQQLSADAYGELGTGKLSVGVLRDGRVRFYSFGGASEDTVYSIGLLTQMLTGIAAQNYLDMDAPAVSYLGEGLTLPTWNGQEITVGQLATQTAGLADWPDNLMPGDNPCFGYSDRRFFNYLAQAKLLYEPGTEARNSAVSAALLGNLMEWEVGGKNTRDINLVSAKVIARAGMLSTYMAVPKSDSVPRTVGHYPNGAVSSFRQYDAMGTAAAGYSSAYDMLIFAAACMDQISSYDGASPSFPKLAREAFTAHYEGADGGRGYGCRIDALDGQTVAWQQSVFGGFGAYFGMCMDKGTAVIVLCDRECAVTEIGERLLERLNSGTAQ